MPAIPPDEDEVTFARRLVAQRCLYGIDHNPMAVDLAKVSLWLSTLARDHPLTFVDHAFRHGDSLVGLTRRQIEALNWVAAPKSPQKDFRALRISEHVAEAAELRRRIREAGEEVSDRELHDLWHDARNEIDTVRLYALRAAALCSNDPVCAEHVPGHSMEERWLHGAACHGCTLIAETSCEMRNEYLDRALVVPTLYAAGASFFAAP